jgi:hypothetical protein
MIQFNKNTFGLAAGEALQVSVIIFNKLHRQLFLFEFHGLSLMFFCG